MQILFSRHGNTFNPGEIPVWVGASDDLPLVSSGVQQAKSLARAMQKIGFIVKAVYCGSLKRTRDYANIILSELHSSLMPIIDPRLNEIDYGAWSGLSNVTIQKMGGGAELAAWENYSQWPQKARWSGSPDQIIGEIQAFTDDLVKKYAPEDKILVITSNGRLRYFLTLIPGAFEEHVQTKNVKVATGNLCLFVYAYQHWQIKFWNKKPSELQ